MHQLWHGYGPMFGLPSVAQTIVLNKCPYYLKILYLAITIAEKIKLCINVSFSEKHPQYHNI